MANEPIELLKGYDPKKLMYPAVMLEKFDGVPLRFIRTKDTIVNVTRQNKTVTSVQHLYEDLKVLLDPGGWLIGEMYSYVLPFKTVSGMVRKNAPAPELVCMVFDADCRGEKGSWVDRQRVFRQRLKALVADRYSSDDSTTGIQFIPGRTVNNAEQAEKYYQEFMLRNPTAEGVVYRSLDAEFQPGTRRWHVQKRKPKPTIDLRIVGFVEAMSEQGDPLGMVGRVIASYNGEHIGVGPGKLTHYERRAIFIDGQDYVGNIAEIEYMQDDTYDALRQATFQRWRFDKETPDA